MLFKDLLQAFRRWSEESSIKIKDGFNQSKYGAN